MQISKKLNNFLSGSEKTNAFLLDAGALLFLDIKNIDNISISEFGAHNLLKTIQDNISFYILKKNISGLAFSNFKKEEATRFIDLPLDYMVIPSVSHATALATSMFMSDKENCKAETLKIFETLKKRINFSNLIFDPNRILDEGADTVIYETTFENFEDAMKALEDTSKFIVLLKVSDHTETKQLDLFLKNKSTISASYYQINGYLVIFSE